MERLKDFEDIEFEVIFVATPLEIALERNEQRAGTRAYVPPEVIANMYQSLRAPAYSEGFKNIYIKEVDKVLYLKEKPNNE
jgi:predicted kinase